VADQDQGYKVKFGGRIMNDWVFNGPDDDLKFAMPSITDGTRFRRARLFSSGTIYHNVIYKAQFDFAGGDAKFKDMYMGVKDVPILGMLRVGHQKEPAGLETLTSSKVITFLERASVTHLMPERQTGILATRRLNNGKGTIAAGVFQEANKYGDATGNDYAFTGRVALAPVLKGHGRNLVHVGASVSYRQTAEDSVFSAKAKPENPIAPTFLETGAITSTHHTLVGGEFAANYNQFSVQSEVALAVVNSDSSGNPTLSSYYVQGSWFLTGESRGYKHGEMSGTKPTRNFDGKGGPGAWELAARYSKADFNDGVVTGGEYAVTTVGVNWYLNPYTRLMLNYAYTDLTGVGKMNSIMTRFQISF